MPARKPKVLLAMSGGVDSSVAAALLVREGYEVVGCFMRLGSPGEDLEGLAPYEESCVQPGEGIRIGHQGCCSINDAADARLVAARLGIPFYVCNFKKDFGRIIDYFVDEYNAGRTPNPCVRCNDWLKFGKLHDYAKQIDAQYVASGHYARIEHADDSQAAPRTPPPSEGGGRGEGTDVRKRHSRLLRGVDHDKDQSYVLFGAPKKRLEEMLLPIGHLRKARVRELAKEYDLAVFDKPDSQEICFVPDDDYAGLLRRRKPEAMTAGSIVDTAGNVLGEHEGHQQYTIGQRRKLGVALGHPLYVVHKNAETNTVTVGEKDDLLACACTATEANWLLRPPPDGAWRDCIAKIRYNAEPVEARVRAVEQAALEVEFSEPQSAVAPGQAVVCYDGEVVVCGGWIDRAVPA